jgi:hypothetical protein
MGWNIGCGFDDDLVIATIKSDFRLLMNINTEASGKVHAMIVEIIKGDGVDTCSWIVIVESQSGSGFCVSYRRQSRTCLCAFGGEEETSEVT